MQNNQPRARGGQELARFLDDHGYRHFFGLPGSSMVGALYDLQHSAVDYVPSIHESVVVAMADGYARVAGSAVAFLYMLPGLANGLANLYNAWHDETPLILLGSQQASVFRTPGWTICEGDLVATARPYTRLAHEINAGMPVRPWLETARRLATGPLPGPVFLSVPEDVIEHDGPVKDVRSLVHPEPVAPNANAVAEALRSATQPLIVVGGQLRRFGGAEAIEQVSTAGAIPIVYESGFSDRLGAAPGHPNVFGNVIGAGSVFEQQADVVVIIGARHMFDAHPREVWFPKARFIAHVNADPAKLVETCAADWVAACDPGAFAKALLAAMRQGLAPTAEQLGVRARRLAEIRDQGVSVPPPFKPHLELLTHLHDALEHGWLVDESVMGVFAMQHAMRSLDGRRYMGTTGASLGWATGAAAGVALASGEPVTCLLGDGALRFGALGLWTIRARNLPITLVVIDNGGYGSTRMYERNFLAKLGTAQPRHPSYYGSDLRNLGPSVSDIIRGFGIPCRTLTPDEDPRAEVLKAWDEGNRGPTAVVLPMGFGA